MKPTKLICETQIEMNHYKYMVQMDMMGEIQNRMAIQFGREILKNIELQPKKKPSGFVTFQSELICMDTNYWNEILNHLNRTGFDTSIFNSSN